jgi:predicted Zn-dependent protease
MAQMISRVLALRPYGALIVCLVAGVIGAAEATARAQSNAVPATGSGAAASVTSAQTAEAGERWDEAVRLYRDALETDPTRSELWVRIADIEARRGDLNGCIAALEHAVAATPGHAAFYARLSQAYATAGRGVPALRAIEGALVLQPRDAEYLRSRATLATWVGDYRAAQDSYKQLHARSPNDVDIALLNARVSAWAGDTDDAVKEYQRYLRAKPDQPDVWLELAKAESWRGNDAAALRALETYRRTFGETAAYSRAVAGVLVIGGQPGKAEEVLAPLLAETPDNYDLNLTRTIALAQQHRTREAFASLAVVRTISPNAPETHSAERVLRTLLASSAEAPMTVYGDSDHLSIERFTPHATVSFLSGTQISAGYTHSRLDAPRGSGLEPLDGSTSAEYDHTWVAGAQRIGRFMMNGQVGYATGSPSALTTYAAGLDARATDSLRFAVTRTFGLFDVSPRSVSLGISQGNNRALIEWSPAQQYLVTFDGSYQELSDGNSRWEMTIAPRRTVARTARFNLDLGGSAYRLETAKDLDHGYYDPRRYEFYAMTMNPYFKFQENIGLALAVGIGAQRDDSSPSFHFGGNVTGEATFGIYNAWALKMSGGATRNRRLESGAYQGFGANIALVRRF